MVTRKRKLKEFTASSLSTSIMSSFKYRHSRNSAPLLSDTSIAEVWLHPSSEFDITLISSFLFFGLFNCLSLSVLLDRHSPLANDSVRSKMQSAAASERRVGNSKPSTTVLQKNTISTQNAHSNILTKLQLIISRLFSYDSSRGGVAIPAFKGDIEKTRNGSTEDSQNSQTMFFLIHYYTRKKCSLSNDDTYWYHNKETTNFKIFKESKEVPSTA